MNKIFVTKQEASDYYDQFNPQSNLYFSSLCALQNLTSIRRSKEAKFCKAHKDENIVPFYILNLTACGNDH
jgi:hypothetical protein